MKDMNLTKIYETMLKELQSAGNAGEFYTPRPVTNFMVNMIKPKLGEKIADFACGTGGFFNFSFRLFKRASKNSRGFGIYIMIQYMV